MPVRDAGGTVAAAVGSVLAQTEPNWELIAVDDGSADNSLARLRELAAGHARIRVLAGPPRGLVAALTRGLESARGAFIARLDADDICLPERLARQRRHLESHPGVGLVACRVIFGGDRGLAAGYARHVDWVNGLLSAEAIALARFVESPLAHPSVMFRRELVGRHGGYREGDFPEDYELWLRWLEAGVRMEKLPEALLVWNDGPRRLSRRDPRYSPEALHRVKAGYLARWLAVHNPHHPRVVMWGAGRVTRRRARSLLDAGIEANTYVDIDPRKTGGCLGGCPVIDPEALPAPGSCFVVSCVSSAGAREQIETRLAAAGYRPGRDYVLAG